MPPAKSEPAPGPEAPTSERLDSWKEIAVYLKRDESTVRRWEKEGLPVRRLPHRKKASVYAYKAEVDAWWNNGHDRLEAVDEEAIDRATWRWQWSKPRVFLFAGFVVVLLMGLAYVWRNSAMPPLSEGDEILLINAVNYTGDSAFESSLDPLLEAQLADSRYFRLFPRSDVRSTLKIMERSPDEPITREVGFEICERRRLKALVVPSIARSGRGYAITLEALNPRTRRRIASYKEEAGSKDGMIFAANKAGANLRKQLGEDLPLIDKGERLEWMTTSSLDAWKAFHVGVGLAFSQGLQGEAIPFYERAIALDPKFESAYRALGTAQYLTGDSAAARKNYSRAFELRARATSEEALRITFLYHLHVTGDLEKALAAAGLHKTNYPYNAIGATNLGRIHGRLGNHAQALEEFLWVVNRFGNPDARRDASETFMVLGRYGEAAEVLAEARQKNTLTPPQRVLLWRLASIAGDNSEMELQAAGLKANDPRWLVYQRNIAAQRGQIRAVVKLNATLVDNHERAKRTENAAEEVAWLAVFHSNIGNFTRARAECREIARAADYSFAGLSACAQALANSGESSAADTLVARLESLRSESTLDQKVELPLIRAIVARQRGKALEASQALAPVAQYENGKAGIVYQRALTFMAAGDAEPARAAFEKLLTNRGWNEWEIYAPLAQLGLARVHAAQGHLEKARKNYHDFFATWKDADPDILILREAKAEYARLPRAR